MNTQVAHKNRITEPRIGKLLIYLPALNEEENIGRVLESIPSVFPGVGSVEILVVDDGSSDKTAEIAVQKGAVLRRHLVNQGVGAAFRTAVHTALELDADVLVGIDADGQFSPDQIPELLCPLQEGKADFVIGSRFCIAGERPVGMPRVKYYGNLLVNRIISFLVGKRVGDASCGFRAFSKKCLINMNLMGDFTYTHESILELSLKRFQWVEVPIRVQYFPDRISRVAGSLFRYAVESSRIMLKGFRDYRPFWFFGLIAIGTFSTGALFEIFVLFHWLQTGAVSPYKGVAIVGLTLLVISSVFFVIALLADMIGRIRVNQERILAHLKEKKYVENRRGNVVQMDFIQEKQQKAKTL